MAKRWYIQEGLYFEEISDISFALTYNPDEISIGLLAIEIDDIINQLNQIKAYYEAKELLEAEKEALMRWRKNTSYSSELNGP